MQPTKKLTSVLRELIVLVDDEAQRNPAFAARLEVITSSLPAAKKLGGKKSRAILPADVPDVFAVLQDRGEEELLFWLRTLDVPTLKAVIKQNGFDPGKVAVRWTDQDKFVALIVEQTLARRRRGAAFLPTKEELPKP